MNEIILKKLSSGKFWLTIISGFTFAYAVFTKYIDQAATASILTAVFMSYFQKGRDEKIPTKGNKDNPVV